MKLYLIRHGETVDNIAGLYAGVRDSALTVHGVEQARRLGEYFAKNEVKISHIFASPLTRAFKTAEAVRKAQDHCQDESAKSLEIIRVPDLIEQDFGFYEGKPFYARSDSKKSGREAHHDKHKDEPGFVDVESKESMAKRADAFLDDHLIPLLLLGGKPAESGDGLVVAVVSHGMLLSTLWRRLLLRLPTRSLTIASEVTAARDNLVLEHLGGWGNTGYLELSISKNDAAQASVTPEAEMLPEAEPVSALTTSVPPPVVSEGSRVSADNRTPNLAKTNKAAVPTSKSLAGYSTIILSVDSKQHLIGIKRQRGGIGRLAHDESQKKLDSFFVKKQRTS